MSIYATQWTLKFPLHGQEYTGCDWIHVRAQAVPAFIGSPTPGYGYEDGDPYADFLPPAIEVVDEHNEHAHRAVVIVAWGTRKVGQQFIDPLMTLTGEEYESLNFSELHDRICEVLQSGQPCCVSTSFSNGTIINRFSDGSIQEVDPSKIERDPGLFFECDTPGVVNA